MWPGLVVTVRRLTLAVLEGFLPWRLACPPLRFDGAMTMMIMVLLFVGCYGMCCVSFLPRYLDGIDSRQKQY